jgi:FlaA1/EpsC-like NDP-sugar epimerase
LIKAQDLSIDLVAELGNVADRDTAMRLFRRWQPQTVFHAAAYKHVPIVEANPIAGLRNNVFSTLHCALAAEAVGVESFILVSTDKAVRPTNIMGASKRVCELVLQARAATQQTTLFTMVRFGNVLDSSGSVVPLFKAQIAAGGPVTVTDFEVTRYFMTIPEAAQLVIQAGGMAKGGDVFVLDMGQSVRIYDLAVAMIGLSGLTVRDAGNPDGDIAIVEIGLRDGEKLYEELLIGDNPQATVHERIVRAQEAMLPWADLSPVLDAMHGAIEIGDAATLIGLLKQLVPEYGAASEQLAKGA